jgi:metallo-beta-lactamase family protein
MESSKVTLTFCAGVGTTTGANFLLDLGHKKLLVDCGFEQGSEAAQSRNAEDFPYDPSTIDILLITHAHIDHIGRIPKLVKDGFTGVIYSTPATRDLAEVMLMDAVRIIEEDAKNDGVLPMYETKHVTAAMKLWKTADYHISIDLGNTFTAYLKDAGHILGSTMYEISRLGAKLPNQSGSLAPKLVFTGDLGNSPSLFLRDTESIKGATYLVMESVYGDRNHESKEDRKQLLTDAITDTIQRGRTLIIPAFSLERTQDIIFEINDLVERNVIKPVPVFLDSPLGSAVTAIYKKYTKEFNESARDLLAQGDDIFDFPKLKFTVRRIDSENIHHTPNPKIIIAGSGMSSGGRVIGHEMYYLARPDATILFVGYQSVGTLGRRILDGAKEVTIKGQKIKINAEIKSIMGYSSHKDSDHLIEFVADAQATLKKVWVAMGEPKSSLFLVQRLRDYLSIDAEYPKRGDVVELDV